MSRTPVTETTLNRGLVAILAMLLLWAYLYRLDFLAPRWEEPRRCLVAFEMIERGNYVVPTVFNEVYTKKPPLQNWLIAALAGFDTTRIHVILPRALTVFSVMCTGALLIWTARRRRVRWAWLALAVYATFGIMVQYGRSAAIDPLFVLWTTGALLAFYWGRATDSPWLGWGLSQVLIAAGILTKGLAPLFVYPPMLATLWLERRRGDTTPIRPFHALAGLAACIAVVALWVVPLYNSGTLDAVGSTGADEMLQRTAVEKGVTALLVGLVRFPIEVAVNLLPWSLLIFAPLSPRVRETIRSTYRDDALFRFCVVCFGWVFICLWFTPGSLGRYVMPAYPFFALALTLLISRMGPSVTEWRWSSVVWAILALSFATYAIVTFYRKPNVLLTWPLVTCTIATLVATLSKGEKAPPLSVRALLLLGFLYASAFVTIHAPSRATSERNRQRDVHAWALQIAEHARTRGLDPKTVPIGCSHGVNQAVCFEITRALNRSVTRPERNRGSSYAVGHVKRSAIPDDRELLHANHSLELWFENAAGASVSK
ncbi:MAG: hypothetical protein AAF658_07220 [Myxococcota bacterium]